MQKSILSSSGVYEIQSFGNMGRTADTGISKAVNENQELMEVGDDKNTEMKQDATYEIWEIKASVIGQG